MSSSANKLKRIIEYIPIKKSFKHYNKRKLLQDLQAGITVGIMLIPQSMAYAVIAGVPPIYGLYACIFPLLLYPVFGTSKHIALGTVAVDMVIIAASVNKIATPGTEEYIFLVIVLAFMVGVIQLIMFSARLGFLINYLSKPVISGFTMAAALIIISDQMNNLLGIKIPRSDFFYDTLKTIYLKFSTIDQTALLLGLGSILLIILIKIWKPVFPTALLIIVMGVLISWLLHLPDNGVNVVGEIPAGLPNPKVPTISYASIRSLLSTAITLALVQFMTIVTIGRTYSSKHGYSIIANQELLALGIGNIFNSFFRGMPASASFSRSAVNEQTGSSTPLSNIFAALVVIFTLLFLTPLFYFLPYPSLAAVVIVAGASLIDIKTIKYLYRTKKHDFFICIFTFVITIFIGIQEGIILGITASLLAILYRESKPNVAELGHLPGTRSFKDIARFPKAEQIKNILVLRIDASFSFANAEYFKDFLLDKSAGHKGKIRALVLDCTAINDLDTTALESFQKINETLKERDIKLFLAGVKGPVRDVMKKAGFYEDLGEHKRIFRSPYSAILQIISKLDKMDNIKHLGTHYKNTDKYHDDEKHPKAPKYIPEDKT